MKKITWRWEIDWSWNRVYLLPSLYVGRHDVEHIVFGAGPNWLFEVGWLFLTVGVWRYSEYVALPEMSEA